MPTNTENKNNEIKNYVDHLYVMYYRKGLTPNLTRVFYHNGDLDSARQRAHLHCSKLANYRLHLVTPFVTDLDALEAKEGSYQTPNPLLTVMQESGKIP